MNFTSNQNASVFKDLDSVVGVFACRTRTVITDLIFVRFEEVHGLNTGSNRQVKIS